MEKCVFPAATMDSKIYNKTLGIKIKSEELAEVLNEQKIVSYFYGNIKDLEVLNLLGY